jgi:hypothetical protein
MGAPELAVVVAIAVPVLVVLWVVRFADGMRSREASLRARVEALERAIQK